MIVSRGMSQRLSVVNQPADSRFDNKEQHRAPIAPFDSRSSSTFLLEKDDEQLTKNETSVSSPRHRPSRRSVQRTVSSAFLPNDKQKERPSFSNVHDESMVSRQESPRRRLQRAASVSVLSSTSPGKGRTHTLARAESKRNLNSSSPTKTVSRVTPRRCASADGSLEMLRRLESLSEEDDNNSNVFEDLCSLTSERSIDDPEEWKDSVPLKGGAKTGSLSSCGAGVAHCRGSVTVPSPRRKPSPRKSATSSKTRSSFGSNNSNHSAMEVRISSLEDELVKARTLIESLYTQQRKAEHLDGDEASNDTESDADDDASAYKVREKTTSGRKFGKILGGVLGGRK